MSRLESPVVMVQGRHDQVAPAAAIERYAELLDAPSKRLVWFEDSAHMPHLEEPGKFRDLLMQLRGSLPTASSLPLGPSRQAASSGKSASVGGLSASPAIPG